MSRKYVIQKGDTLSQIARRLKMNTDALAKMNAIKNKNKIFVGQELKLEEPRKPLNLQVADALRPEPTAKTQRSQEDLQMTPTMIPKGGRLNPRGRNKNLNPRGKIIKSKTTADPVRSTGLMARSKKNRSVKPETIEESQGFVGRVLDYLKTTPGKAYAKSWIDSGVWDESILEKDEFELQKEIATQNVNRGLQMGSYKHFTDEGGSKMSYQMETPEFDTPGKSLQYLLGQHKYVRKGNDLLTADEYDYGETGPDAIKNQSFVDRAKYVYDKFEDYRAGKIKDYGFAHHLAEAFGATPGEGASVRINLGNHKDLGVDPTMFNNLPTIKDYEKEYEHRITKRPLRDLLSSTYDKTKSLLVG